MNYKQFAAKLKAKYPEYADMSDLELATKMVGKFPGSYPDVEESIAREESVAQENAEMPGNIVEARSEAIPEGMSALLPYSSEELAQTGESSFTSAVKDVFSMPGRFLSTGMDADLEEMKRTSENTKNPFAAALKSPVTGATMALAPVTAGMSLVPGMATAAGTSLLAGYGLDEDYGTSNAVLDIVSSLLSAAGPAIKAGAAMIGKNQIRKAIIDRGLTPTKELVEQIYQGILTQGRNLKASATNVAGQKSGKLASDMDIYALGKGFPKEAGEAAGKAVDYSAGRTRDITAAQAAKARIPQLKADIDYLAEVAKSENGISPDRIRQELQKLLQKYGDIPEAIDIISRTLSTSKQGMYRDQLRSALEGAVAKILQRPEAVIPVREALPWSNYVNDLAAASAVAEHVTTPPAFAQYMPLTGKVAQTAASPAVLRSADLASVPMGMYLPQVLREIPEDK